MLAVYVWDAPMDFACLGDDLIFTSPICTWAMLARFLSLEELIVLGDSILRRNTVHRLSLIHIYAAVKSFGRGRGRHQVLFDVNVEVWPGECLGIIGASGSGKSTLTRIMFGLEQPDSGDVLFNGVSILGASGRAQLRSLRAASGIVYQNPFASLDPR